jgi:hypothetical protein
MPSFKPVLLSCMPCVLLLLLLPFLLSFIRDADGVESKTGTFDLPKHAPYAVSAKSEIAAAALILLCSTKVNST